MGGDPIPGPLDEWVRWFEAWKATLPKVTPGDGRTSEKAEVRRNVYLHGRPRGK